MHPVENKTRLSDIDKAKGLAIFMVVIGHIVATKSPTNNEWYEILKFFIYKFHMPFFMYLSGIIFAYTYKKVDSLKSYLIYLSKKTHKLLICYMLFGSLIYLGKSYLSRYMIVDDLPGTPSQEFFKLLITPSESAGGSLWFIYVLVEMYITFPILIIVFRYHFFLLVLIGVVLAFIKLPHIFLLDRFGEYFLFFAIGSTVVQYFNDYLKILDRFYPVLVIIFIFSFFSIDYFSDSSSKLLIGFFSLFSLHSLVRNNKIFKQSIWFIFGKYTFIIYLMNTIAIGLVKGLILLYTNWDDNNFYYIAPILLTSGCIIPILIKKYIIIKIPRLDNLTT